MRTLTPLILLITICFACSSDEVTPVKKDSILGFWSYTSVTYNSIDRSETVSISNYLHLSEDFTYDKCYITGTWKLSGNKLSLSHPSGNGPDLTYTILSVTEDKLQLLMHVDPNEDGIAHEEFDENKVTSILETFERHKE